MWSGRKIETEIIKDIFSRINDFGDRHSLCRQLRAYISNVTSTSNALDSSYNKEVQQATKFCKFFTKDAAEKIYIDMKKTLGYTGQKDPKKSNKKCSNKSVGVNSGSRNWEVHLWKRTRSEYASVLRIKNQSGKEI